MRSKAVLIVVLLLCAAAVAQSTDSPAEVLLQADRDFNKATALARLEGWMQFMTDDTVIQQDKAYIGPEAIRAALKDQWDNPSYKLTWWPDGGQLFESGKMGYTTGHFVAQWIGQDGKPAGVKGQYLTMWKKQKDGTWKVLWDGGSASGPAMVPDLKH